jgi:diguanylate cyclase (GGDEF)-like protein
MSMGLVEFTTAALLTKLRAELEQLRGENQRLAALAYRDPLTGLRNRRFFTERLSEEVCRVNRHQGSLSLVCIDVNRLKLLNDTLGHAAGDAALAAVGRMLELLTRAEDLCCRVGGDEFVVVLPDTDAEQCRVVLERIRSHQAGLEGAGLGREGLAVGTATWREGDDEARLLARADAEMYAAKRAARDLEDAPVDALLAKAA